MPFHHVAQCERQSAGCVESKPLMDVYLNVSPSLQRLHIDHEVMAGREDVH